MKSSDNNILDLVDLDKFVTIEYHGYIAMKSFWDLKIISITSEIKKKNSLSLSLSLSLSFSLFTHIQQSKFLDFQNFVAIVDKSLYWKSISKHSFVLKLKKIIAIKCKKSMAIYNHV